MRWKEIDWVGLSFALSPLGFVLGAIWLYYIKYHS